jgi:hypothetical protein
MTEEKKVGGVALAVLGVMQAGRDVMLKMSHFSLEFAPIGKRACCACPFPRSG